MTIYFYVAYPYYFPHFLPISEYLEELGHKSIYILSNEQNTELMIEIAKQNNLTYLLGKEHLFQIDSDYTFFANVFRDTNRVQGKTIFMNHGTGTKASNYKGALEVFDFVLVEGTYREKSLQKDFPQYKHKIKRVGFSKLDGVINFAQEEKEIYIEKYNLDPTKPTILYAPTFFPSSIEKMSPTFPDDFKECNIIVKPHYLSLHRSRYKKQQKLFKKWASYSNCSVCDASEYNLVPFLNLCDIMISDESSAIFEFTALDKPVILNRFLKLRWSYYLNPKKLLNRLDAGIDIYRQIGDNAYSYKEMIVLTKENLEKRDKYHTLRQKFTAEICGEVDGKVSERIYNLMRENQ